MKEHRNITVKGNVKEIDFLYYTELFAIKKNIDGFIQNGSMIRVYIEAEADPELLDDLENFLKGSPLGARVNQIISEKGELKDFDKFKVMHDSKKKVKKESLLKKAGNIFQNLLS
jgi:acylphosphatase